MIRLLSQCCIRHQDILLGPGARSMSNTEAKTTTLLTARISFIHVDLFGQCHSWNGKKETTVLVLITRSLIINCINSCITSNNDAVCFKITYVMLLCLFAPLINFYCHLKIIKSDLRSVAFFFKAGNRKHVHKIFP